MTGPTDQPQTPPPWGQPPGGGYPPPPMPYGYQAPAPMGPRNGLGIAALILAIVGLLLCWSVVGGVIVGIFAALMGFIARGRVKRGEADNGGVAIAGIVLGFLSILAGLAFILIWAFFWIDVLNGSDYFTCMNKAGQDTTAQQQCTDQFRQHLETKFSVTLTTQP